MFLLIYNKIHKKQKFSSLDIFQSPRKEMWLVLYVTCVIAQVSLTRWSIFLVLDMPTLKLKIFADKPTRNNSPDCAYNKN